MIFYVSEMGRLRSLTMQRMKLIAVLTESLVPTTQQRTKKVLLLIRNPKRMLTMSWLNQLFIKERWLRDNWASKVIQKVSLTYSQEWMLMMNQIWASLEVARWVCWHILPSFELLCPEYLLIFILICFCLYICLLISKLAFFFIHYFCFWVFDYLFILFLFHFLSQNVS